MGDDSIKSQLKKLRDDLAAQSQRALTFASAPSELSGRLRDTSQHIASVYLKVCAPGTVPSDVLDELCDDALVEGALTLNDWSTWVDQHGKPRAAPGAERRVHARDPSTVSIKLLRHHIRGEGADATVDDQAVDRLTKDVSSGGAFVLVNRKDLPLVTVGHVLHVSLPGAADVTKVRARVIRRDDFGLALQWIVETPTERQSVDKMVSALKSSRK